MAPTDLRRHSLLVTIAAGAAALPAVAAGRGAGPPARPVAPPAGEPRGYRVTAHVRNFYKAAATL